MVGTKLLFAKLLCPREVSLRFTQLGALRRQHTQHVFESREHARRVSRTLHRCARVSGQMPGVVILTPLACDLRQEQPTLCRVQVSTDGFGCPQSFIGATLRLLVATQPEKRTRTRLPGATPDGPVATGVR